MATIDFLKFTCSLHIRLVNLTPHLIDNKYINHSFDHLEKTPNYFFAYIIKGSVMYESDNGKFIAGENEGLFIPKNISYTATWEGNEDGEVLFYSLSFDMYNSDFTSKYCNFALQPIHDFSGYKHFFEKIYQAYRSGEFEIFKCIQYFSELYYNITQKLEKNSHTPKALRVQNAIDYIERHYTRSTLSVPLLASLCHLSVSRFFTVFKEETGQTPIGMKHFVAISHAISFLIETNYTIDHISNLLGFSSTSYFCRTFKTITGRTPSSYREQK